MCVLDITPGTKYQWNKNKCDGIVAERTEQNPSSIFSCVIHEIIFYADESHKLQQAITIDGECNNDGSDIISLGAGDDLVGLILQVIVQQACDVTNNCFPHTRHLEVTFTITLKEMMGKM